MTQVDSKERSWPFGPIILVIAFLGWLVALLLYNVGTANGNSFGSLLLIPFIYLGLLLYALCSILGLAIVALSANERFWLVKPAVVLFFLVGSFAQDCSSPYRFFDHGSLALQTPFRLLSCSWR
jgi:hypothetical protein